MKPKIVIGCFLAFLILPSLLYPAAGKFLDTGNHENRTLAPLPEFTAANYGNITSQLSAYYDDHLPFKNQLVRVNSFLEKTVNVVPSVLEMINGTENVTRGKDGWLFYTVHTEEENSVEDYLGTNRYTEEELVKLAEKYNRFSEYLSAYGGEAVLFLPPNKETVYSEYMPDRLKRGKDGSRTKEALLYLAAHTDVTVVSPEEALLSNKENETLYYKYDTHWNRLGAFVGDQALTKVLQGESRELADMEIAVYGNKEGDLSNLLGTAGENTDDPEYAITDYKPEVTVQTDEEMVGGTCHAYTSDAADTRSVLMLGDSFSAAMLDYLPKDFATVWVTESEEEAAKLIKEKQPDIVLLEIVERRAECLENVTDRLMEP